MIPIELFGQISKRLSREDYDSLRSSCKVFHERIPFYDSSDHLTRLQEKAFSELFNGIVYQKETFATFCTPSSTGASFVLSKLINEFLLHSTGIVIVICDRERRTKWENRLRRFTDFPFEASKESLDTSVRIHLVILWTTHIDNIKKVLGKNDLVIIADAEQSRWTYSYVYEPPQYQESFIGNIYSKTSILMRYTDMQNYTGDLFCCFKPHRIPIPAYPQEILLIQDLYKTIDYLMNLHDRITILGGIKKYLGPMKRHAKGRYNITKDSTLSFEGKTVLIHDGKAPLSGVILIRVEKGEREEFYADYSFLRHQNIERVYWHVDNGKVDLNNGKIYASRIFRDQIEELIYRRFFQEDRKECRDYMENKEGEYIMTERSIKWNSRSSLESILKDNPMKHMEELLDRRIRY